MRTGCIIESYEGIRDMKKIRRLAAALLCGLLMMTEAGSAAVYAASADGMEEMQSEEVIQPELPENDEGDVSDDDAENLTEDEIQNPDEITDPDDDEASSVYAEDESETVSVQAGDEGVYSPLEEAQSLNTDESIALSETDIAGGTVEIGGKLTWVIDQSGKLTVQGTGDAAENPWEGMPWKEYCEQILSAEIDVQGMVDASYLLKGCSKLTSVDVSRFDTSKTTNMSNMFYGCENLTSLDVRNFDTSKTTDMSDMFFKCKNLASLDVSRFDTRNVQRMDWMFAECGQLTSLDVRNFNTSKVRFMDGMFNSCSSLISVDVSGFDTHQVEYMDGMFAYCNSLKQVDVSGFDTSRVTDLSFMFRDCNNLTSVDVSWFDTSQVTNLLDMFYGCGSLKELDVRHFDTSSVTSIAGMFCNCANLTSLDLSSFDFSNVDQDENDYYLLAGCEKLQKIYAPVHVKYDYSLPVESSWYQEGGQKITSLPLNLNYSVLITKGPAPDNQYPYLTAQKAKRYYAYGEALTLDDLTVLYHEKGKAPVEVTDYQTNANEINMFVPGIQKLAVTYNKLTSTIQIQIDSKKDGGNISGIIDEDYGQLMWLIDENGKLTIRGTGDITKDTEYYRMPWYTYNYKIKSAVLDVDGMTDASYLFYGCGNMLSVDLSRFDTGQLINTEGMFSGCGNLTSLDLSGFDTSKVTSMRGMFSGCANITSLDIAHFDTGQTTRMDAMFSGCNKLSSVDISKFDTKNVTSMGSMFNGCEKLSSVDVSKFDTINVTSMRGMFNGCKSLTSLDVSGFDISQVTDLSHMFGSCEMLTALDVTHFVTNRVTNMSGMFIGCTKLKTLDLSRFATGRVTDMSFMFDGCDSLTSLDLSHFDTGQVTNMSSMLSCGTLTQVDVSNFDTRNVTEMYGMFQQCKKLTSLDVSSFDIGKVEEPNLFGWLSGCDSLASVKTPTHVKDTVELPVTSKTDLWRQEGRSEPVTEFPKDLAYSVLLEKNKIPDGRYPYLTAQKTKFRYECGERLNTDDLTVLYYKQAGEGEKVTAYTTNADSIDMSVPGKKELMITYEGQTAIVKLTVVEKPEDILPVTVTYTVTFDLQGHGTVLDEYAGYTEIKEGARITEPTAPADPVYNFEGWYKEPSCENQWDFPADTIMADTTLYARWIIKEKYGDILPGDIPDSGEFPEELWAASVADVTYTGKAIKPKVHVYWGNERLDEGIDYTVKYKNNTKVNDATEESKAPCIMVKGKNHCSGDATVYFKILPVNLSTIEVDDLVLAYTGKEQKKAPVIKWNGKKLSLKKDIKVIYPDENKSGAYREEGTYAVHIEAAGSNFTGSKDLNLIIRKGISMARAKVAKIGSKAYTGGEVKPASLEVTIGKDTLTEGTDYIVAYKNCTEIGTATVVLTGIDKYAGTKTVTYKITGTSLKGAKVDGLEPVQYNGAEQEPKITVRTKDGAVLTEENYTVTYSNNKNAGKATVTITGIKAYTGMVKKTFRIQPYDLEKDEEGLVKGLGEDEKLTAPYDQDGSKPNPQLSFNGRRLLCGRDYSMTCKNNKSVTSYNASKKPEVVIKGKGNFNGKVIREFTIMR